MVEDEGSVTSCTNISIILLQKNPIAGDTPDLRSTNNGGSGINGGGGAGLGYRGTFVTFTILSILTVAYAACYMETQINIIVYIPTIFSPGKCYLKKYYSLKMYDYTNVCVD